MKKALLPIAIIILVVVGSIIVRTYPRHIDMLLEGVQYKLGSPQQGVKPVTLELNGTLHRSLRGRRTFDGTVNVSGTTFPNKANGKLLEIPFDKNLGGQINER